MSLKKIMAALCAAVLLGSGAAMAAPDTLYAGTSGSTNDLIVITNPPSDKAATFDMSYIISGYGQEGATVTIYLYENGVYNKTEYSWKIGASGLFFKKITLAKGKNAILCYAETNGGSTQVVPLEITYLGSGFLDALNNVKVDVNNLPFK